MYIYIYVYIYIYICVYKYIYTYTHTYIYICIWIHRSIDLYIKSMYLSMHIQGLAAHLCGHESEGGNAGRVASNHV